MRILDESEQYHFNIRGPLIVGAALSSITSLVHIFLKIAWLGKFTQTFRKTYCLNYALCSRQLMNEIFDEKWIKRSWLVVRLPRSPNPTSPDYFLWDFVEERVMAVAPTTPDDMKEKIRRACTEITTQMLAEGLFISELTSAYKSRVIASNIFCR